MFAASSATAGLRVSAAPTAGKMPDRTRCTLPGLAVRAASFVNKTCEVFCRHELRSSMRWFTPHTMPLRHTRQLTADLPG